MSTAWDKCAITSDLKQSVVEIAEVIKKCPGVGEEEVVQALELASRKMRERIRTRLANSVRNCNNLRLQLYSDRRDRQTKQVSLLVPIM